MKNVIKLEERKREKRFKDRYLGRKYLIKAMLMYKDKYSLEELEKDYRMLLYSILKNKIN